jgi:hypothetical protein
MNPLVSFVVPCYKLGHFLPQCINSILVQTYKDFEVLIMDNCSPDSTPEVARSFHDPRIKHIRNEANIGHIPNFNKGITLSGGKYVWLISADDFLLSNQVLERYVDVMERNPRVGFVFCRAIELHPGRQRNLAAWGNCGDENCIWNGRTFLRRLIRYNCVAHPSGMVRKECHRRVNMYALDLPFACDWYLWCTLSLYYDVAYCSEPMACVRVHEESMTSSFSREGARPCIVDELTILWRVAQQAEVAGFPGLRGACEAALVERAVRALEAETSTGTSARLSDDELATILQSLIKTPDDAKEIQARVYVSLADRQYWDGRFAKAAQSYQHALSLRSWRMKTWAKYLLLRMGGAGLRIRQLSGGWTGLKW